MVAAMLGKPLMEWQQHVADIILEIDPDTGCLAYDEWVVLTPRQSGKSTFILVKSTHRGMATKFFGSRQHIVYTAQTRLKAREKWEEDFVGDIRSSPRLKHKIHPHLSNGHEHLRFPNGSRFGIEANKETSGHGSTLDEAYIDEAFAQVDNRMEQAFGPAMITRVNKQLGVISTAGWLGVAAYLWDKVIVGRKLIEDGVRSGTAYFEWSAPDDADPASEAVWLATMPALHRPECGPKCKLHTITLAAIRSEYDKAVRAGKLSDFCRAYLNQWKPKPKPAQETALGDWASCGAKPIEIGEPPPPLAIGVGVSIDREWASIGSATRLPDGRVMVAATDRRPGVEWLAGELLRIQTKHGCAVVMDDKDPGFDLIPSFEATGVVVTQAKLADFIAAGAGMKDGVRTRSLVHLNHPSLDEAVVGARWRKVGDRLVLGRTQSETEISMLVAAALAAWGAGLTSDGPSVYEERGALSW